MKILAHFSHLEKALLIWKCEIFLRQRVRSKYQKAQKIINKRKIILSFLFWNRKNDFLTFSPKSFRLNLKRRDCLWTFAIIRKDFREQLYIYINIHTRTYTHINRHTHIDIHIYIYIMASFWEPVFLPC